MVTGSTLLAPGPFSAQEVVLEPVYNGFYARNISWSHDSRFVSFQPSESQIGVQVTDQSWYQYDVATGVLSKSNTWPHQYHLTAAEQMIFNPAGHAEGTPSFILASPSGRYIVYGRQEGTRRPITLGDRDSGAFISSYTADNPFLGPDVFNVLWSADESAFAMISSATNGGIATLYGADFNADINSGQIEVLHSVELSGQIYSVVSPYDISTSEIFLLHVVSDTSRWRSYLMVFNYAEPHASLVIQDFTSISSASFAPFDETKLLIVTEMGLVLYDLATLSYRLLDSSVNSDLSNGGAYFSPDGEWLALSQRSSPENVNNNYLYIVNTLTLIPLNTANPKSLNE